MRPLLLAVLVALVVLGLAACSGDEPADVVDPTLGATAAPPATETAPTTPQTPPDTPGVDVVPAPTGAVTEPSIADDVPPTDDEAPADPDPAAVVLALEEVASLDSPTATAVRPGDPSLYVAERAGTVRAIRPDGTVGPVVVDISESTATNSERGLLGLAWAPDGQRLYLSSSDTDGATRLEAFDVVDDVLDQGSRTELLRVPQPAANHNGGDLHVGPDGYLWLGLGDGGAADDAFGNGQRPDTLLGTMLRIDPEGGDPYAIPPDNPWADGGEGAPEVWAYGLRNPWRFSFDATTGRLWIADVGQNAVEEINAVDADAAGLNYGWPRFEGDRPFDGQPADGPVVEPVHTYTHQRGCSITGGYVYRGQAIEALRGAYLYTDFCNGSIYALDLDAEGNVEGDVDTGLSVESPVSFGQGPDGELYVLSLDGPVHRIVEG